MIYCDTSLLIAALTIEASSESAQHWLGAQAPGSLCISPWVISEFSSALSLKLRRGDMPRRDRDQILSNWRNLRADSLDLVPVSTEAFELAARFCERETIGLRAGDALHLAVASIGSLSVATLDKAMAQAAATLDIPVASLAT